MTAYKMIIGACAIILLVLLWIPLDSVFNDPDQGIVRAFNNITTNSEVQDKNAIAGEFIHYTLVIFIVIIGIWMIKPDKTDEGYNVYA